MKWSTVVRFSAYAAALVVFWFAMETHHAIPVGITSGSAETDVIESLPVHFLGKTKIKGLPEKLATVSFPCSDADFVAAIGFDPDKLNLPWVCHAGGPGREVREYVLAQPTKNHWLYELVVFYELIPLSKPNAVKIHKAEVWVVQSAGGEDNVNMMVVKPKSFDFESIDQFRHQEANQAPVPTATSVTPAADAPVAPAAAAAQL